MLSLLQVEVLGVEVGVVVGVAVEEGAEVGEDSEVAGEVVVVGVAVDSRAPAEVVADEGEGAEGE